MLNVIISPFEPIKLIGKSGSQREPVPIHVFVITTKPVDDGPQYSVRIRDWKTGNEVASDDFSFQNSANAKKMELSDLDTDELPKNFAVGGPK